MTTVTGYTKERMDAMEAATIVDGDVIGNNLILKRHDGGTIDAGNVRGPTGAPGVTNAELQAALAASAATNTPVGIINDYIGTVAPAGWLLMQGQTIVDGQTTYPALWAVIPLTMKSGANIVMPDTRGRVSAGYDQGQTEFDAIGEVGGEKVHTLISNEMPIHSHVQPSHTHTASSGLQSIDHSHAVNINTSQGLDDNSTAALPGPYGLPGYQFVVQHVGGGSLGIQTFPAANTITSTPYVDAGAPDISHYHNVNGSTGGASANHSHTVTVNSQTATNNNTGGGAAHNNLQPYVVFQKMIKAA